MRLREDHPGQEPGSQGDPGPGNCPGTLLCSWHVAKLTRPTLLIFLNASFPVTCRRRNLDWTEADYAEQHHRLRHARQFADLYIFTDDLSPEQVAMEVIQFLDRYRLEK